MPLLSHSRIFCSRPDEPFKALRDSMGSLVMTCLPPPPLLIHLLVCTIRNDWFLRHHHYYHPIECVRRGEKDLFAVIQSRSAIARVSHWQTSYDVPPPFEKKKITNPVMSTLRVRVQMTFSPPPKYFFYQLSSSESKMKINRQTIFLGGVRGRSG